MTDHDDERDYTLGWLCMGLVLLAAALLIISEAAHPRYDYSSPNQHGHEHEFIGKGLLR